MSIVGNGTNKLGGMLGDAVSKIGLPGVFALILLYGIWKVGSDLTESHIVFLKAAQTRMETHQQEDLRITAQLAKLVEGQEQIRTKQAELVSNQGLLLKILQDVKH